MLQLEKKGYLMLKITLIDNWKTSYKFYTMWILSFITMFPQIWNQLVEAGVISSASLPKEFTVVMTSLGAIGMAVRIMKQNVEKINQEVAQEIKSSETTSTIDPAK